MIFYNIAVYLLHFDIRDLFLKHYKLGESEQYKS